MALRKVPIQSRQLQKKHWRSTCKLTTSATDDDDTRLGEQFDIARKEQLKDANDESGDDTAEDSKAVNIAQRAGTLLETLLIADFFFVVLAALMLVVALIARGNSSDNGPLLNLWLQAWPVIQAAISMRTYGI